MKTFLVRHIRNMVVLKIGVPTVIAVVTVCAVFMFLAAVISTILSPVETVTNVVTSFFSIGDSSDTGDGSGVPDESGVDLRTCVGIDQASLSEVLTTVPPHTDLTLARAWITFRAREIARGGAPAYDSIVTFQGTPAAQQSEAAFDAGSDTTATSYDLAAIAGVVELVNRGILTAPDEDTLSAFGVALVDHCMP